MKLKYVASWDSAQGFFAFAPSELARMLREMPVFEGRELSLEIKRHSPTKTQSQLGFYFSAVLPWIQEQMREAGWTGITVPKVRKLLEGEFLKDEIVNEQTGEIRTLARSIADLTKLEMSRYIEDVNGFCLEWFNCPLPEPLKKTWTLP